MIFVLPVSKNMWYEIKAKDLDSAAKKYRKDWEPWFGSDIDGLNEEVQNFKKRVLIFKDEKERNKALKLKGKKK